MTGRLSIGQVFAGYRIDGVLGHGGMGTVYLARHPRLPQSVALKLLAREVSADDKLRRRFHREAEVVALLDHPGIVPINDRGEDQGHLWIAMRYVHGTDAGRVDPRSVTADRAVRIIGEAAAALDYAHSKSVIHRDVKPSNILLAPADVGRGERATLTDFGIARLRDATQLTDAGEVLATLAFASPEQLSGQQVDPSTDQYSLACTLFALLTGSGPFTAAAPAQMIAAHLTRPIPWITRTRPDLPAAFDKVLERATAKSAHERFRSCGEFASALTSALRSGPVAVPPSRIDVPSPDTAATTVRTLPPPVDTGPPNRHDLEFSTANARSDGRPDGRKPAVIGIAVMAVVLVIATIAILVHGRSGPHDAAASAYPTITGIGSPDALAIDSDGRTLYIADGQSGMLSVADTASRTVRGSVRVSGHLCSLAVDQSTHLAYVLSDPQFCMGSGNAAAVVIVDTDTLSVVASIPTFAESSKVAVDTSSHTAYVLDRNIAPKPGALGPDNQYRPGHLSRIDPASRSLVPVHEDFGGPTFAIDPASHIAYTYFRSLTLIDLTGTGTHTITMPLDDSGSSEFVFDIAFDSDRQEAYAATKSGVFVIDTRTNGIVDHIRDPSGPEDRHQVVVDSTRHRLYVLTPEQRRLTVIDTASRSIVDRVSIDAGKYGSGPMAFDQKSAALYIAGEDSVFVLRR
ncbi:serine/threonine-protein kinase [Nocardia sp. BMG111209]|uniref:serine/threonine-protein kinase n=1 Tax=Nocardia sp. BMG111209 TaxID=1160137 RepID=UPI000379FB30|nr:serine/threonine-protein kinase [Nocardia sp. BMG111209]